MNNEQLSFDQIAAAAPEVTADRPLIIQAQQLAKSYTSEGQELKVLKGLDLEFRRGEFAAIIGPSGAGKSTLLHLLGLIDQPTAGRLIFEDTDISAFKDTRLAKLRDQKIGFIFQFYHLLPEFTVLENILMPCYIRGKSFRISGEQRQKALALLAKVNLSERAEHLPSQLSGGEQQRVAIARALINDPELVLADEPTGNLDGKSGLEIMKLLQKIHEVDGKTVIIVTHNEEYAKKAQRVIKLKDGRIVQ